MASVAERASTTSSNEAFERLRTRWSGMAGRLGMGVVGLGLLVILIAWNGAAGLDYAQGQLPYLLSGGFGGLGLIVVGASLIVAESNRRDRAVLEQQLAELNAAIKRLSSTTGVVATAASGLDVTDDIVIAGRSSFHRPDCRLVEGRGLGEQLVRDVAEAQGLSACRVCQP
jgi:hypothetical protein